MKPHSEQAWLKPVFTNDKGGKENFGWQRVINFLSANQWEGSPWIEAHKAFHKKKLLKQFWGIEKVKIGIRIYKDLEDIHLLSQPMRGESLDRGTQGLP